MLLELPGAGTGLSPVRISGQVRPMVKSVVAEHNRQTEGCGKECSIAFQTSGTIQTSHNASAPIPITD